jgi:hypothetical protein
MKGICYPSSGKKIKEDGKEERKRMTLSVQHC